MSYFFLPDSVTFEKTSELLGRVGGDDVGNPLVEDNLQSP